MVTLQGRIQDFKLGGALKKIGPSGGRRENFLGISCEKSRFYAKNLNFSNFRGGVRRVRPPGSAPALVTIQYKYFIVNQDAIVSCTIKVHL